VESNPTLMLILAYYLYQEEDYNKFFLLLSKTKNPEFLALKIAGFLRINRVDLADQALN
jgi:hypothetical protein